MKFLQTLRDWSEVWALLIPLAVIIITRPKEKNIRLLIWYVILGFILNFIATFMLEFYYLVPSWMRINNMVNNNLPYNIHSALRVLFFSWYIINIRHFRFAVLLKAVLIGYVVFILINFIFIESPFFLSTRVFAAESTVLLIMCLSYFFRSIQDESETNWLKHPSFLICAGVVLYEGITFFIFLFFYPLSQKEPKFFILTMQIYSYAFVLLCIFLAAAFYRSTKPLKQSG